VPVPTIPVMRPWLGEEEAAAAAAAVASGWVAQGPRVAEFESAVAARVGAVHGIAVSSCTAALHLALVVLGVGPGDEVVVPSFSFVATANVVRYVGATPVFADVDPSTGNLSAATVEPVLGPRTRAVILVHQGGVPADVDDVRAVCTSRGVEIVEDAACAIGATLRGAPIGSHSDLVAFSFHPRKVITTGEGGLLTTGDAERAARLRRLREHGMSASAAERHRRRDLVLEHYLETGFNYRMTDIQAAVGSVQLGKLDEIVARRRTLAARYREQLADVGTVRSVDDPPHGRANFQSFWIELAEDFPVERDELLRRFLAEGVSPRRGIMASHLEPAYASRSHGPLPVTERLTRRTVILPLYHEMTEAEQDRVVDVLRREAGAAR